MIYIIIIRFLLFFLTQTVLFIKYCRLDILIFAISQHISIVGDLVHYALCACSHPFARVQKWKNAGQNKKNQHSHKQAHTQSTVKAKYIPIYARLSSPNIRQLLCANRIPLCNLQYMQQYLLYVQQYIHIHSDSLKSGKIKFNLF